VNVSQIGAAQCGHERCTIQLERGSLLQVPLNTRIIGVKPISRKGSKRTFDGVARQTYHGVYSSRDGTSPEAAVCDQAHNLACERAWYSMMGNPRRVCPAHTGAGDYSKKVYKISRAMKASARPTPPVQSPH
jgi:hypothetical protein